jgi:zinc protease
MNLDLNVDDPDYPALMLADYIFGGGGLRSRLMDRIRQKEGLSYGGGSQLVAGDLDRAGMFGDQRHRRAAEPGQGRRRGARGTGARAQGWLHGGGTRRRQVGSDAAEEQNRADDGTLAAGWTSYMYRGRTYEWSAEFEKALMAVTLPQLNAAFRKASTRPSCRS